MAKVMIVDDNKSIVETLKMLMEKIGYQTEQANNGEDFLGKVEQAKPDVVLLDVMMPGLTTRQILEKLNEKGLKELKVILVTVVRFSEEQLASLKKDFNIVDYVTKPFEVPDIVAKVKKQLS